MAVAREPSGHKSRLARQLEPALALVVIGGSLFMALFVDHFGVAGILGVLLLLVAGPGTVLYGLTLSASEHATKPQWSEEGYLGLWIAHHLPLRLARAGWVILGLALSAVLMSILLSGITSSATAVIPQEGRFAGTGTRPHEDFVVSMRTSWSRSPCPLPGYEIR